MPTYQYRCKDCNNELEVVQKFTDDALTDCPECTDGELRKVYNAVGVVFKGSGFYRTDSRTGNEKSSSSSSSGSAGSGSSGGESKASTPAPAAAGASAGSTSSGSTSSGTANS